MFQLKKKVQVYWYLAFFALIALGIIISTSVLILKIINKANQGFTNFSTKQIEVKEIKSPEELQKNYKDSINSLLNEVLESKLETKELLTKVETVLFTIRVPKEKLDQHLQFTLFIGKLQGQIGSLPDEEIKKILSEKLAELVK